MKRPAVAVAATVVVVALATFLAGCSVPRERDRNGTAATSGAATPAGASGAVTAPSGSAIASGTGARAGPAAVSSPVAVAVPTPAAVPSPSPPPAPVRVPVPHRVPGYTLTAAPDSLGNPLGVVRGARDLFGAAAARSVDRGGAPVGVLMLLALRPEYVGNRDIERMLVPKVVAGMTSSGVKPAFTTWSGLRVAVAMSAKDGTIVVWYSRGVLGVVVAGADPGIVSGYARAYVASR